MKEALLGEISKDTLMQYNRKEELLSNLIIRNDFEATQLVVAKLGADELQSCITEVTSGFYGGTPAIHWTLFLGQTHVLQLFISKLSDRNIITECLMLRDKRQMTPIHYGCLYTHNRNTVQLALNNMLREKISEVLLQRDVYNTTPLYFSTIHQDGELFHLLSEKLTDISWKEAMLDTYGKRFSMQETATIFHIAVERSSENIVKYILRRARRCNCVAELLNKADHDKNKPADLDLTKDMNVLLSKALRRYILPERHHKNTQMRAVIAWNSFEDGEAGIQRAAAIEEAS